LEPSITTTRLTPRLISTALAVLLWLVALAPTPARAAHESLQLFVTEPYLELHTGPGRGYPVQQVVERGESVRVLFRRTDWFRIRTESGFEGWADAASMNKLRLADGTRFSYNPGNREGYATHRWEAGITAGSVDGASLISGFAGLSITDHLHAELTASQFLGDVSTGYIYDVGLMHIFAPEWRLSPFLTLGTGWEVVNPLTTLTASQVRGSQTAYVGGGLRMYMTRRFFVRAEFRNHEVFTHTNFNEVQDEWKVGFGFYF